MRKGLWIVGLLIGISLILSSTNALTTAQEVPATSDIRCDNTHEGNLILWFNEVFIIEGITYCQIGNVYVYDYAKLAIRNGALMLFQMYGWQWGVRLQDSSSLDFQDATVGSDQRFQIWLLDNSNGQVTRSNLDSGIDFILTTDSSLTIQQSSIGGVSLQQWGPGSQTTDFVTLTVEDSSFLHGIELVTAFSPTVVFSSLAPGHYGDWNLTRDNDVQDLPMDVILIDTNVRWWYFEFGGFANITFNHCEVGVVRANDQADVTIRDSEIDYAGLVFGQNQVIELSNLRPGYLSYWSLQDLSEDPNIRQSFVVQNSQVRGWEVVNGGSHVTITDSEIGALSPAGGQPIIIRSYLHDLGLGHNGKVIFEDATVQKVIIHAITHPSQLASLALRASHRSPSRAGHETPPLTRGMLHAPLDPQYKVDPPASCGVCNTLSNNTIELSKFVGMVLYDESNSNLIWGNTVEASGRGGIALSTPEGVILSNSSLFYHNNLIEDSLGEWGNAIDWANNRWDNGSKGNYWSDYTSWDGNGDGIGDIPYRIKGGFTDRYPLMRPWKLGVVVMGIKFAGPDEFVTVRNWSEEDVDLTGWQLQSVDLETQEIEHAFSFPQGCILPADGRLRVHSGPEAAGKKNESCEAPEFDLYQGWLDLEEGSTVWDDLGGIIRLIDDQGEVVDEYEYGWWMGG